MSRLNENTILSVAYDIRIGGDDEQVRISRPSTGEYYYFTGLGSHIWRKIQSKPVGLHWLVVDLTEKYQCDYPQALRDVVEFCSRLVEENLLTAVQYDPKTGKKSPLTKTGEKNVKGKKKQIRKTRK